MNDKQSLLDQLAKLRADYEAAKSKSPEERRKIVAQAKKIKHENWAILDLCYTCKEKERTYNEYYCSKTCEDAYYGNARPATGRRPFDINYVKKRIQEAQKRAHLREEGKS